MAAKATPKVKLVEYEIVMKNETVRVSVPSDWKVTYGTLHGGANKEFGERSVYLRFYEATDKQRMVFADVQTFRDTSIPFKRLLKKESLEIKKKGDSKGNIAQTLDRDMQEAWEEVK